MVNTAIRASQVRNALLKLRDDLRDDGQPAVAQHLDDIVNAMPDSVAVALLERLRELP